ncbi:hypothetical protein KFK09_006434 [Dendrobium nobile]|uniref:AD domain-containing protein n=1 Tax=Dendrobium nobile TaxID=94219 RepID=A0A8T3BP32_DENNO|nr:hypothetical protein KFK09_006434 [Dendrobium nobile]
MDSAVGEELGVGCFFSFRTTLGEEFEGQIITYDRPTNIEGAWKPGGRRNVRFLKTTYIKDLTFLRRGDDPLDNKKCFLDLAGLQAREEAALRLPVRWDKTAIVVMDEVRVNNPYFPENVNGGTPAANERVKKVLELERRRLQVRSSA